MKGFFKKSINYNLVCSILFLIAGCFMFLKTAYAIEWVTLGIEILLVITGITIIINYIRSEKDHEMFSYNFTYGIASILLALFLILNPKTVISILPVVIGIWMVIGSLIRLQFCFSIKDNGNAIVYIIGALIMFTCGMAIICNPFTVVTIIVKVLGGVIFIYSVIDIIEAVLIKNYVNKM